MKDPEKRRASNARYIASGKRRVYIREYMRRYRASEQGRVAVVRYRTSEKGRALIARYYHRGGWIVQRLWHLQKIREQVMERMQALGMEIPHV